MNENTTINNPTGSRPESVNFLDKYFYVQFSISSTEPIYIFKLRSNSTNGLFVLAREDSAVLKHLKVGDIVNMRYNTLESLNSTKPLKTLIRSISKNPKNLYMGHSLIELSITEQYDKLL